MPDSAGNPIPMVDVLPTQHEIHVDYSQAKNLTREAWRKQGYADAFVRQLDAAIRKVAPSFGLPPEPTAEFVTAHACLSSGFGRSKMTQLIHNTWGIKAGKAWTGDVLQTPATEYKTDPETGKKDVPYTVMATWRAYPDLEACVRDYLKLIMTTKRYHESAKLLQSGDLDYMAQLGRDGWYTHSTGQVKAEWLGILKWVQKVIASPPGSGPIPFDIAVPGGGYSPETAPGTAPDDSSGVKWWHVAICGVVGGLVIRAVVNSRRDPPKEDEGATEARESAA